MSILSKFQEDQNRGEAKQLLLQLVQSAQYVGDVYSIGYAAASVQIHDYYRQQVGGIPSLCFLLATRIQPNAEEIEYEKEDASIILLRVMDAASLPDDSSSERIRVELAQKVAGEVAVNWDSQEHMDPTTHHLLSFGGVKCRVLGTFFVDKSDRSARLVLRFGSDLSNYYPNRGLKVYKPNKNALEAIVNYVNPDQVVEYLVNQRVEIGDVRYASTNRSFQGVADVPVRISPADLLGQKTALFGMTRTGKSNTTKIMLQSVFKLRFLEKQPMRIGQLVFDLNGEYANENAQDADQQKNPSAIKNVWRSHTNGKEEDVVTYGMLAHPNDPARKLMLLNFLTPENLQLGKDIIDEALLVDENTKYIQSFCQVRFQAPVAEDANSGSDEVRKDYYSQKTRYDRQVLAYRALLIRAGFMPAKSLRPYINKLFPRDLLDAMFRSGEVPESESESDGVTKGKRKAPPKPKDPAQYREGAMIFQRENLTWPQVARALEILYDFIEDKNSGYQQFNERYMNRDDGSGDAWADEQLKKILQMFRYPNGTRQIAQVVAQHTNNETQDYAADIYNHLINGRLVIVDQSSGDEAINKSSAERIVRHIFQAQQQLFRTGEPNIPHILLYVEEAHNLLPADDKKDYKDIWVRTAKEGSKYHIGLVYATQEVSSIQRNILKNTANWFIGHLNNADETRELCKYYDFADFEQSIRRAQDRGFLRVKTLSNMFVVPVQVRRFEV